jgi:hypothetical protein
MVVNPLPAQQACDLGPCRSRIGTRGHWADVLADELPHAALQYERRLIGTGHTNSYWVTAWCGVAGFAEVPGGPGGHTAPERR